MSRVDPEVSTAQRPGRSPRRMPHLLLLATALAAAGCGSERAVATRPVPTRLALTVEPATLRAGTVIVPAVRATVQADDGRTVSGSTASVSIAITSGTGAPGATLGGTLTRAAVNGIATFDDLTIDKAAEGYTLTVQAPNLASATSAAFSVEPGAPAALLVTTQPATVSARRRLTLQVTVRDASGNTVAGSNADVTVAITGGTGTAGAVLLGTLTRAAVGGVATFNDLSIGQAGTGYTLTLTAPGLTAATTPPFDVTPWSGTPTLVSLEGDAGDFIGGGLTYRYTQANAVISASATGGRLSLRIDGDQWWVADFQSPDSLTRLAPGTYGRLARYPFHDPATGGLSWSGEGRGCNTLTGWFAVDSVAYDDSVLVGIDLRFEQRCGEGAPALRGTIHWDAFDPTAPPGPVSPVPSGLWAPSAGSTPASGNYVYLESDVDDYIGQGKTHTYTPTTSTIDLSTQGGQLTVTVAGWRGVFRAMHALPSLQPGYYADLRRFPFHNATKGGLEWSGQGRGCNVLAGWFAIDSVAYQDGLLAAIALRFEQRCEARTPALRGAIRWTR